MNTLGIFIVAPPTWIWLLTLLVLALCYFKIFIPLNHWRKKGLKMSRWLPVLGDTVFGISVSKEPYPEMLRQVYEEAGKARYIGYYEFITPILMIKSPDLIKELFVKHASKFGDRRIVFPDHFDELISKNIFYLKGQEWKETRSFWNYVLSSNRVEKMYTLLNESACTFVQHLTKKENEVIEIDLMNTIKKYICDFSASLYFGITQTPSGNEFDRFFQHATSPYIFIKSGKWCIFKYYLTLIVPNLSKLFGVHSILKEEVHSYFMERVKTGLTREKIKNHRQDCIGLVVERQKEENSESSEEHIRKDRTKLSETAITAQLSIFLFSSLDGLAATLRYIMYELAMHQDIQKRLREEFEESCSEGDHPSYNTIINQPYLDMVISETMRKWPAALLVDRVCTESYKIEAVSPDEHSIQLEVGDTIAAPLYGLHHDPRYFPNPTRFDPERFSIENRSQIKPFTYLPWGIGSKNCNGGKLALLMMKTTLFHLLQNFEIIPTSKTPIPITLKSGEIKLVSKNNINLGLRKRKSS